MAAPRMPTFRAEHLRIDRARCVARDIASTRHRAALRPPAPPAHLRLAQAWLVVDEQVRGAAAAAAAVVGGRRRAGAAAAAATADAAEERLPARQGAPHEFRRVVAGELEAVTDLRRHVREARR